jgi:hypothetical protein
MCVVLEAQASTVEWEVGNEKQKCREQCRCVGGVLKEKAVGCLERVHQGGGPGMEIWGGGGEVRVV